MEGLLCSRLRCTAEKADHPVFKLTSYQGRGHSKLMTGQNKRITISDYLQHPSHRVLMVRSLKVPHECFHGRLRGVNQYLCARGGCRDVLWYRLQRGCVAGTRLNHTGRVKHQYRNRILVLGSSKHSFCWALIWGTRKCKARRCS